MGPKRRFSNEFNWTQSFFLFEETGLLKRYQKRWISLTIFYVNGKQDTKIWEKRPLWANETSQRIKRT